MGYINKYILGHNIRLFIANQLLTEMITNKHVGQWQVTKISNKKGKDIDGIWASQGIIISQGGYLSFHNGP